MPAGGPGSVFLMQVRSLQNELREAQELNSGCGTKATTSGPISGPLAGSRQTGAPKPSHSGSLMAGGGGAAAKRSRPEAFPRQ